MKTPEEILEEILRESYSDETNMTILKKAYNAALDWVIKNGKAYNEIDPSGTYVVAKINTESILKGKL